LERPEEQNVDRLRADAKTTGEGETDDVKTNDANTNDANTNDANTNDANTEVRTPDGRSGKTSGKAVADPPLRGGGKSLTLMLSKMALGLISLLFLPAIFALTQVETETATIHQWLPVDRQEKRDYDLFQELFGEDQYVIASWPGCSISDQRVQAFSNALTNIDQKAETDYIRRVRTTSEIRQAFQSLSDRQFYRRFGQTMIGRNGTAIVAMEISETGIANPSDTIELIRLAADKALVGRTNLRLAGSVFEIVAVDQASDESLRWFVAPSSIAGALVAWLLLKSLRRAILVLLLACVGQVFAIAMLHYSGGKFSAFLIVLPTLVFMLTLSSAIHLLNYWIVARQSNSDSPGVDALLSGWRPCLLAALTTIVGMGSLAISQLQPVRSFGWFSSLGLFVSTIVLLSIFAAASDWLLGKGTPKEANGKNGQQSSFPTRYSAFIVKHNLILSCSAVVCLCISIVGVSQLQSSTKFEHMFPENSQVLNDIAWIESNVGPVVPIEILLQYDTEKAPRPVDVVKLMNSIERSLRRDDQIGGVSSLTSIVGSAPTQGGLRATARRAAIDNQVFKRSEELQAEGMLVQSETKTIYRLTARVAAIGDLDYGTLTERVRNASQTAIDEFAQSPQTVSERSDAPQLVVTGVTPVIYEAQQLLLNDLRNSFVLAFVLITPVVMLILRSVIVGAAAMIPNVLPVLIVFGTMGLLGYAVDMAGILTASVALGIAVDDTLHFAHWYSHGLKNRMSSSDAVCLAITRCSKAMLQTTAICSAAMLPFFFSSFLPTAKFATLMIGMLVGAIVGDLIFLPAILASPIGRRLQKRV
jgi:hypothetical protein